MKIKVAGKVLFNHDDSPIIYQKPTGVFLEDGNPEVKLIIKTADIAIIEALSKLSDETSKTDTPEKRLADWALCERLKSEEEVEITAEELVQIRKAVSHHLTLIVAGQILDILSRLDK